MDTPLSVVLLAKGDEGQRQTAVTYFREWLKTNPNKGKWPTWARFMSEVDSVCPDLLLRSSYRKQVVAEAETD